MKFVKAAPNSSGAYQGPRSVPFPGCLPLTDGQAETLVAYNGFVTITREPDPEIEGSSLSLIHISPSRTPNSCKRRWIC